jgi:hypothetical protein
MKQSSELRDLCASALSPLMLLWLRLCRARILVRSFENSFGIGVKHLVPLKRHPRRF